MAPRPCPSQRKWLSRRKAVTIAAGFECADGIVLATDLVVSDGMLKRLAGKSTFQTSGDRTLAIAGAGYYDVLAYACAGIVPAVTEGDCSSIIRKSRDALYDLWEQHIDPFYDRHEKDQVLQLIVGILDKSTTERQLYVSNRSILRRDGPYIFVGCGWHLAYYLAKQWWKAGGIYISECAELAERIIQEVGDNVPDVGNDANITTINFDGKVEIIPPRFMR